MKTINQEEFDKLCREHSLWLEGEGIQPSFENLSLINVKFDKVSDLRWAKFAYSDLSNISLYSVNFEGADMRGIKAVKAYLNSCCFVEANFENANLEQVNFAGSNLNSADLTNSNLYKAFLNYTDLRDSKLEGANLKDIKFGACKTSGSILENINRKEYDVIIKTQNVPLSKVCKAFIELENITLDEAKTKIATGQEFTVRSKVSKKEAKIIQNKYDDCIITKLSFLNNL